MYNRYEQHIIISIEIVYHLFDLYSRVYLYNKIKYFKKHGKTYNYWGDMDL